MSGASNVFFVFKDIYKLCFSPASLLRILFYSGQPTHIRSQLRAKPNLSFLPTYLQCSLVCVCVCTKGVSPSLGFRRWLYYYYLDKHELSFVRPRENIFSLCCAVLCCAVLLALRHDHESP